VLQHLREDQGADPARWLHAGCRHQDRSCGAAGTDHRAFPTPGCGRSRRAGSQRCHLAEHHREATMKQQIETLGRLASLRSHRVRQMLGRVQYQQNLCQRYRNNITGLSRLCGFSVPMSTPLQRDNQQRYKATLYKMVELQRRELAVAEQALERIQRELLQAMRSEKVVEHMIDD